MPRRADMPRWSEYVQEGRYTQGEVGMSKWAVPILLECFPCFFLISVCF